LTVLRTIKQLYPYRPVIMFTATGTQEVAVQAMKSGLDDYIIKSPKHYARLTASVRRSLQYSEAERRAAELQMRLNDLLERLHIGVYRGDTHGKLLECNPAFLALIGVENRHEAQAVFERYFTTPPQNQLKSSGNGGSIQEEVHVPVQKGDRWFL